MKKIAHVLGSKRITADILTVLRVIESLNGRFSFDVIMPCDAEYRELFLGSGSRILSFESPSETSIGAVMRFARYFSANPADIVHTHVSPSARVGALLTGIKKCISTRSFIERTQTRNRFASFLYNRITSATVCHSLCVLDGLVEEGIRRDRIFEYFPHASSGLEPIAKKSPLPTAVVCPLPLYDGFGHGTLLRAYARLDGITPPRLIMLGTGPREREYKLLASKLGIGGRVEFLTNIMSIKVYKGEQVLLVYPQEKTWEIPIDIFLGLSCPVLASDIPENREFFEGKCDLFAAGDMFSLERALRRLCEGGAMLLEDEKSRALSLEALCGFYDRLYSSI